MALEDKNNHKERILRKYPNRRIYDTTDSQYVSFTAIQKLISKNILLKIINSKTHEDVTRSVLIQIIAEEGFYDRNPFSLEFMKQLIRLEGNAKKSVFGEYLEKSLQTFSELTNQFVGNTSSMTLTPEVIADFLEKQNQLIIYLSKEFVTSWITSIKSDS